MNRHRDKKEERSGEKRDEKLEIRREKERKTKKSKRDGDKLTEGQKRVTKWSRERYVQTNGDKVGERERDRKRGSQTSRQGE